MSAKMNPSNTSQCDCPERRNHQSILYTLLSSGTSSTTSSSSSSMSTSVDDGDGDKREEGSRTSSESSGQETIYSSWDCPLRASSTSIPLMTSSLPVIIKLKYAEEVCPYVAQLLLKTVDFIRNLPSVLCLARPDRARLLQHCWSELLILTMAQCRFRVQVEKVSLCGRERDGEGERDASGSIHHRAESVASSRPGAAPAPAPGPIAKFCPEWDSRDGALLKYIIATQGIPTTSDVDTLNAFFQKCQSLEIDDKEFAYLKATIFFNPDVGGLSSAGLVETLQGHAQLKLSEYVAALHPRDPLRFAHLLLSLPPLRNVRPRVVTQLFFRDLIGDGLEMEEILQQMLASE